METKRGKQIKLLSMSEWWELMYERYPQSRGTGIMLMAMEQAALQSQKYKVCIECLASNNLIECKNYLLPTDGIHSKDYYMCRECVSYYDNK